jgi:hypothetical protein
MKAGIFALTLLLSACAASDEKPHTVLEQAPVGNTVLRGDYQRLANCAYHKFTDGTSNVMQKNDFPDIKQSRVAMMGGSLKAW